MALHPAPPAGSDPNYQVSVAEQYEAQILLAQMDEMEEFAQEYDKFDQLNSHLPPWELACQRQSFANIYRRLIGVIPDQREQLRLELQQLSVTGHQTVEAVIASVRNRAADAVSTRHDRHPHDPFA